MGDFLGKREVCAQTRASMRYHFQRFGVRPCKPQKSVTTARKLNLFSSRFQIRVHILLVIKNGHYNGANPSNNFATFPS